MTPPRVAILGGGMAGLATAWELSRGDWRKDFSSITVYQRGWRLGGKGASSRGEHGRIEEHGLHVLLGYYDATFEPCGGLRRACATTDPNCPPGVGGAVEQAPDVGLTELHAGRRHFVTRFDQRPPSGRAGDSRPRPRTGMRAPGADRFPPQSAIGRGLPERLADTSRSGLDLLMRTFVHDARRRPRCCSGPPRRTPRSSSAGSERCWRRGDPNPPCRRCRPDRTSHLATGGPGGNEPGAWHDGILLGGDYRRIDHLDYRDCGRARCVGGDLDSPIVRGMYDLTSPTNGATEAGPASADWAWNRPADALRLQGRSSGGCGRDGRNRFAPLYQALAHRGVAFEFFHRLDEVVVENRAVAALRFTQQAELAEGRTAYEPLIRVRGIPAWPARPLAAQLAADPGDDLETHGPNPGAGTRQLRAGEDFDVVVMAVPVGMVPYVARGLTEADSRWRQMVDNVGTVATRSAQLWLRSSEHQLGWDGPAGVTLSGFGDTFDTWASMSHLLSVEEWPPVDPPRSLAYLCGAMPDVGPGTASASVREAVTRFLDALIGGIRYYDASADDARHTMMVARTAAHYGAVVRTSTQVVGFLREADRVTGVRVRDVEDGRETDVRASVVVNCTGVWTDELQHLAGSRGRFRVRASKGVHIVVPRDRIVSETGLILRTEKSVLFVIPWRSNHWIVGTTDTDWNLDLAHPAATKNDIDYILSHVNKVLATPLTHDDIEGVYAGLRPLLAGESEETSKLSREHAVARVAPGLVAIAGGNTRRTGSWPPTPWTPPRPACRGGPVSPSRTRFHWWAPTATTRW